VPDSSDSKREWRISLRNLGPKSRQWLAEIGIYTIRDLRNAGSIATYKILKEIYPETVSLNLLWGLEAAIRDVDWRELTETDKEELRKKLR
jgi:DNA transformation protein and related proteins